MSDNVKYVVDAKGKPKEVIIPIDLWNKLATSINAEDKKMMSKKKLGNYFGVLKLSVDPLKYQKEIRNEWQ
ncbi:MAG: hypothetical protein HY960_09565 [Ignavibacteriae bacterium]|nr:hypothetical protein [Ignavibacteriota bacterium]